MNKTPRLFAAVSALFLLLLMVVPSSGQASPAAVPPTQPVCAAPLSSDLVWQKLAAVDARILSSHLVWTCVHRDFPHPLHPETASDVAEQRLSLAAQGVAPDQIEHALEAFHQMDLGIAAGITNVDTFDFQYDGCALRGQKVVKDVYGPITPHIPAAHIPWAHIPAAHIPAALIPWTHIPAARLPNPVVYFFDGSSNAGVTSPHIGWADNDPRSYMRGTTGSLGPASSWPERACWPCCPKRRATPSRSRPGGSLSRGDSCWATCRAWPGSPYQRTLGGRPSCC